MQRFIFLGLMLYGAIAVAQVNVQTIRETKKEYIKEHHIQDVEDLVHQLAQSRDFLNVLLKNGHKFDPQTVELRRKDVKVGEDIDLFVKHISEHQTFTMLLLPVSFYSLGVYDTILFTSLEVSDEWLESTFEVEKPSDSLKSALLAEEGHVMLEQHVMGQASQYMKLSGMGEVEITIHESYISANSVSIDVADLSREEKKSMRRNWSAMKKMLTHNVNLNVELNVYVFGVDDMDVTFTSGSSTQHFKVNPSNVFQRHRFVGAASAQ